MKRLTGLLAVLIALSPLYAQAEDIYDPIESVNRGIFWFNDKVDVYVMEPVARTYDENLPDGVKRGVGNFFSNLRYPQYLLSDVVQFRFEQAAVHTGRFLINSTVGLLGIFDVAKHVGLEKKKEDFGLSLARYGVPAGPYLVLPLLGPSNLRDTFGLLVDGAVHPFSILTYTEVDDNITLPIVYGGRTLEFIDTRADLLDAIKTAKESSLDYYLFLQSAYYQHRRGEIYEGKPPPGETDANSLDDDVFEPRSEKAEHENTDE